VDEDNGDGYDDPNPNPNPKNITKLGLYQFRRVTGWRSSSNR